jgi:hypothetical protein
MGAKAFTEDEGTSVIRGKKQKNKGEKKTGKAA